MDDSLYLFFGVALALFIGFICAQNKSSKIGAARCKRCQHVGTLKGVFVPFRGEKMVCRNCGSEDWEKV